MNERPNTSNFTEAAAGWAREAAMTEEQRAAHYCGVCDHYFEKGFSEHRRRWASSKWEGSRYGDSCLEPAELMEEGWRLIHGVWQPLRDGRSSWGRYRALMTRIIKGLEARGRGERLYKARQDQVRELGLYYMIIDSEEPNGGRRILDCYVDLGELALELGVMAEEYSGV